MPQRHIRWQALLISAAAVCAACAPPPTATVLDKRAQLARFDFWDNRDVDWFTANIPFLETPDPEIDETWYYRWEVLTKHLVYGSPEVGYTVTEFIDRPFWSGAYGSISCPLGHQMYELRWLEDRRVVEDFARYWLTAEGAEPRSYSNWYGDAVWAAYRVLGDRDFAVSMLPLMEQQYAGWVREHWDAEHRMFRWDGMHDGMETNISSRQTTQWFDGAEGYRPTLNSYLYGDAVAIFKAASLAGDLAKAEEFRQRAEDLRSRVQEELWDPERQFFFHQFADDERTEAVPWPGQDAEARWQPAVPAAVRADGSSPPITAGSLVYESGPWAGDPHGREEIGFVPWQFDLPEPGYEAAWKFLFDPAYFWTEYGPTTTEQGDPLFYVSPRCCVWSGNSWPYATTQTLVALANLLNDYDQDVVDADDYFALLKAYTRTQRRDGEPFIAEAADPYTGSWAGHDTWFHSEHYLHSGYVDPVITGLIGLRPQDGDALVVNPLVPADWDWFALDDVAYRGHRVSVLWDRDGSRYGRGAGLRVLVDGEVAASSPRIERLEVSLQPVDLSPVRRRHDVAVHNDRTWFPAVSASSFRPEAPPARAVDGQFWYHTSPPNRWVTSGTEATDWLEVDFGVARRIDTVKLYFLDDEARPLDAVAERAPEPLVSRLLVAAPPAEPPESYRLSYRRGGEWIAAPGQHRTPELPAGRRANTVTFAPVETEAVRVDLVPRAGSVTGLSEIEVWSDEPLPLAAPTRPPADLAFNPSGEGFPSVSASYSAQGAPVRLVADGETAFNLYSDKRWSAQGTPHASDWIEVDFGADTTVDTVDLYLWAWPGRGTAAPASYRIETWRAGAWQPAVERSRWPERPLPMALNRVQLEPTATARLRVVFEHAADGAAAVSELVVRGAR